MKAALEFIGRTVVLFAAAVAIGLVIAPFNRSPAHEAAALRVPLMPLNNSGETGAALIASIGRSTRIAIDLHGEPTDASQPANVHDGTCHSVAAIRYPLNDVRNGQSTSLIPVTLAKLLVGRYVINVQSSAASLRAPKDYHYVSCGELRPH
jgi:hypothetical protein